MVGKIVALVKGYYLFGRKFGIIFLVTAISLFVILFFYIREERFMAQFRNGLEKLLSEAVGAEVAIGYVGGNIFKKALLYDIECRLGEYRIKFRKARLEYSLWEVVSRKKSVAKISDNLIELEGGLLSLKDNLIISKQINGRVCLRQDKIIIEGLDFVLFSSLNNHIRGEIIKSAGLQKLRVRLEARPSLDKTNLFFTPHLFKGAGFTEAGIDIEGPFNDLNFNGSITGARDLRVLVNGSFISKSGVLRLNSRLNFKDLKTERENTFLTDIEVDPENTTFRAVITPSEGNVIINGDYSEWPLLTADITNDHIKLQGLDFSNIVHLASKLIYKDGTFSHIALDIFTESTILNYYPFNEFELSCWIDEDLLRLLYLKAGDTISASGALSLKPPRKLFLKLLLSDFDISRLLLISKEEERPIASGSMSGEAVIEGSFDELRTKANFGARYGHIGTIDYEDMLLNMEGTGPILTIYDSRLIREDSFMTLEGTVDIRRIGQDRFLEDLTISTAPNTIIWDGWDISKVADQGKLILRKGVNGKVRVGFTTRIGDDEITYRPVRPQDELELEYKMPDDDSSLQLKTKEKEEFFGLKKRYKF